MEWVVLIAFAFISVVTVIGFLYDSKILKQREKDETNG